MNKFWTAVLPSSSICIAIFPIFILAVSGMPAADLLTTNTTGQLQDPELILHEVTAPSLIIYNDMKDWETWKPSPDVIEAFPYYKAGYDFDGLTVYVVEFGKWNYREWAEKGEEKQEEFWKYFEQFVRRHEKDSRSSNDAGVVEIVDFDGFSLSHHASSKAVDLALRMFTSLIRVNHSLKYGFYVNVNFGAETFINVARPFMGTMLEKYEVCGTRMDKCKRMMLSQISADQLPSKYGGTDSGWKPVPFNA